MKTRRANTTFHFHSQEAQDYFRYLNELTELGEILFSELFEATLEYLLGLPEHPAITGDIRQLLLIEN